MPEALAGVPQTDGILWLALAVVVAGLVRGFSGFGSAMIIMPVASSVLSPFAALAFLTVVEFFGPLPNLSSALRVGRLRDVLRLDLGGIGRDAVGPFGLGRHGPRDIRLGGVVDRIGASCASCSWAGATLVN